MALARAVGMAQMETLESEVSRRTLTGIRWALALNLAGMPLSFSTNVLLGRVSPEVLGQYGAIQLFVGSFQTFFILGGAAVFTRFVPALRREERMSFLLSYATVVVAGFLIVAAVSGLAAPRLAAIALARFGDPGWLVSIALCLLVVVWAFSSHFLYGILEAAKAALTIKLVIGGWFVAGVLAATVLRENLTAHPGRLLWSASVLVYGASALIGTAFVMATPEGRLRRSLRFRLPEGFWRVVGYVHFATLVDFVYWSLSPFFVLLWLDLASLGRLHAALRWPGLLAVFPTLVASVLSPALSTLEAGGRRDQAFQKAQGALRLGAVGMLPATLALVLFAGDAMAVFGPDYRQHRDLLGVVALSVLAGPVVQLGGGLAIALGAFRAYAATSVVYIAAAVSLSFLMIPRFGLPGAAFATTLGALVHQTGLAWVLRRRLGFRLPPCVWWAWACAGGCLALTWALDVGRPAGLGLLVLGSFAFAWGAGMRPRDALLLARRLLGSGGKDGSPAP